MQCLAVFVGVTVHGMTHHLSDGSDGRQVADLYEAALLSVFIGCIYIVVFVPLMGGAMGFLYPAMSAPMFLLSSLTANYD